MVLGMTEVEFDIHTKQDGVGARKPDYAVSRSEKSALVSNQAAEHALRTALRNINHMQQAAAQQHAQQVQQFLDSISDDVFTENMTSDGPRRRLQQRRNSRSLDDVTLIGESQGGRFLFKRPDSLDLSRSSSQDELPDIQKRSSAGSMATKGLLSPRDTDSPSPRRQAVSGIVKRLSQLSPSDPASCPNSPLTRRRRKVEKLDVSQLPGTTSDRARASSFTSSPTSASVTSPNSAGGLLSSATDGRVRTSSFTGSSSGISANGALPNPRRLRAQVEKNIQSELETARKQAARKKRLLDGKDSNESWEHQIARDQMERGDRLSSDSEEEVLTNPYSISSSMRISRTAGTFEKKTGKQGLQAWMGRPKGKK